MTPLIKDCQPGWENVHDTLSPHRTRKTIFSAASPPLSCPIRPSLDPIQASLLCCLQKPYSSPLFCPPPQSDLPWDMQLTRMVAQLLQEMWKILQSHPVLPVWFIGSWWSMDLTDDPRPASVIHKWASERIQDLRLSSTRTKLECRFPALSPIFFVFYHIVFLVLMLRKKKEKL